MVLLLSLLLVFGEHTARYTAILQVLEMATLGSKVLLSRVYKLHHELYFADHKVSFLAFEHFSIA